MSGNITTFASLNLSDNLLKAIDKLDFKSPSPIQEKTIPALLQNQDMIALAQTGTGKTAAFAIPILQNLDDNLQAPQALILAPTRELAIQVGEHIENLGFYHKNNNLVTILCGGQDYRLQLKKLKSGTQIVVGTPGRILDHIERGSLVLKNLRTFVLDEADEMLRMGFIEDVESVLTSIPSDRQIALFSATMPDRIRAIAKRFLKDPISVEIKNKTKTVSAIDQRFLFVSQTQKTNAMLRILEVEDYQGVIVFVRTKAATEEVARDLIQQGYSAMAINGDLTQSLREKIISQFKQGTIDILVATDVAARGLDVERVTHVINYDMVQDCETYVHRIGRTGRAGRSGVTILFVTPRESRMLNIIERHTNAKITKVSVPSDAMIMDARENNFIEKINSRVSHKELSDYKKIVTNYLRKNSSLSAVDLASILALMANNDKPWDLPLAPVEESRGSYSKFDDPRTSRNRSNERRNSRSRSFDDRGDSQSRRGGRRDFGNVDQDLYRLDVGRKHGVKPSNIVGAIANESGINSRHITALQIHDYHSMVKLPKNLGKDKMHAINQAWVCGRQLNLTSVSA